MNASTLTRDALIPRNPDGIGRGLGLALLVHALLIVAIAFGVSWRSSNPAGIEAELWASVPQIAAPKPAEPEPTPQPKKVEPPPAPKVEPVQKVPDAQIAIEKAKREELLRKKEELEQKKKEAAEKLRREQAEAQAAEKRREDQIARMAALAGTGEPTSTGTAARTAGPSAGYAGRIIARLRPLSVFAEAVAGNPKAEVEIRVAPDGTIIGRRLVKSSGIPAWDDAVLRAIDKAESLPRDVDGRVQNPTIVIWGPRD